MSVNKVILLGNVCQDPVVRTFDKGGKVAQFSLATNKRAYKTKEGKDIPERSEFHNVVINMAGLAEVAEKYVQKGDKLYIEGELRTRTYDSKSGEKHYITEVYVSAMELLTPKRSSTEPTEPRDTNSVPAPAPEDDMPF